MIHSASASKWSAWRQSWKVFSFVKESSDVVYYFSLKRVCVSKWGQKPNTGASRKSSPPITSCSDFLSVLQAFYEISVHSFWLLVKALSESENKHISDFNVFVTKTTQQCDTYPSRFLTVWPECYYPRPPEDDLKTWRDSLRKVRLNKATLPSYLSLQYSYSRDQQ